VVARHPHPSELASCLRDDLRKAGCTRAELYVDDPIRANIVYHDLRGTAATWMAIRQDLAGDIKERLGHGDPHSTQLYIKRGRLLARAFGGQVFPRLPPWLLVPNLPAKHARKHAARWEIPQISEENCCDPNGVENASQRERPSI
jgi:hypothetical protein